MAPRVCSAAVKWLHTRCHVREQGATLTIIGNPSAVPQKHINRLQLAPTPSTTSTNFDFSADLLSGRPTARLYISGAYIQPLDHPHNSRNGTTNFLHHPRAAAPGKSLHGLLRCHDPRCKFCPMAPITPANITSALYQRGMPKLRRLPSPPRRQRSSR